MTVMRFSLVQLVAAVIVLSACAGDATLSPGSEWLRSEPEAQGMDSRVLDVLDREFASGKYGYVDGMMIFRHGSLVYERHYQHDYDAPFHGYDQTRGPYNYYDPDWHPWYERGPLHSMQSVSKSVTSALIGVALQRGELAGVDIRVMPFFAEFASDNRDPLWGEITLRDLLTMTSGIEWDESSVPYVDLKNMCAAMEQSDDWIQFVLAQSMRESPGASFEYNSGVTMMLAHILVQATGKPLADYAEEHLFRPLGIDQYYWKETPTGLHDAEGGLYLEPGDLARFGELYASDGVINGTRILPVNWVQESMEPATRVPDGDGRYGYQWWLLPYAGGTKSWAYSADGYGGQFLLIVPEYDLIAVFTGWNIYGEPTLDSAVALQRVLEAMR
ncbi:MAG: serine hydrolase [Proteobacteria bacterium]|nr:serine hydrolase [Pseudomonadota bacterium]MDA1062978.1 serine hydrolase [Pseudomonadota bacterium]